jgi:5-methyltetrahydrofolate--homocysteine methyltransferase
MTSGERLAEARNILDACEGYGIAPSDVVIDAICMPVGLLESNSFQVTLETITSVHQMGIATQIGVGNASSGLPGPTQIDLAYLLGAMPWGLDAAFINPNIQGLTANVRAMDMLTERDPNCRLYLKHWRSIQNKTDVKACSPVQ